MRTLRLKVEDPHSLYLYLPDVCLRRAEIKDDVLTYKLNNELTFKDDTSKMFFITLGTYLYPRYIEYHLKKKKFKDNKIKKYSGLTEWTITLMALKIEQYFQHNDNLNERVFFDFNLSSLGKDVDRIISIDEAKMKQKKDLKALRAEIKKKGLIDFNDYKTVFIDYDPESGLIINSEKKNEYLTLENMGAKLGLALRQQTNDQWQMDLNFCLNTLLLLNVKKIIIPEEMYELIEDLEKNPQFLELNIEVEVIPSN